jgi:PAS domain-containing protein
LCYVLGRRISSIIVIPLKVIFNRSNHEYIAIAQSKHPRVLGLPFSLAWSELWTHEEIKQSLTQGMSIGYSTRKDNDTLFMNRGIMENEETYFDWSLIPFPREGASLYAEGHVGGLVNPCFENTQRVIMDRRLKLLREMGQKTASARSTGEYWRIVISALQDGELDVPGCVVYGMDNDDLAVVGQIGLNGGHQFFPLKLDTENLSNDGFEVFLQEALQRTGITFEDHEILSLFEHRGWGDPLKKAVIAIVRPSASRKPQGVLFLVLSSRRPYDEDYMLFIELLTWQIATGLANVQLLEEKIQKAFELAEIDRQRRVELKNALELRTKELRSTQDLMSRVAEIAPVGIFVSDGTGAFEFVNDIWVFPPFEKSHRSIQFQDILDI